MKKTLIVGGILLVILFLVLGSRFFGGLEDAWICEKGDWIKHGNPADAEPQGACLESYEKTNIFVFSPKVNVKVDNNFVVSGKSRVPNVGIRVITDNNIQIYEKDLKLSDVGFNNFEQEVSIPNLAKGSGIILQVYNSADGNMTDMVSIPLEYDGETDGLVISSFLPGSSVVSPLRIVGYGSGNDWSGFEGQAGTVKLYDSSGTEIAFGILSAVGEWMQLPIYFETYLSFVSDKEQNGTLVFKNENPSGNPEWDRTVKMPVKLLKTAPQTTVVKTFFGNTKFNPNMSDCSKVYAVNRTIPKTDGVARAALMELFKGPTDEEKNKGYATSIANGSEIKIQGLMIDNKTAFVDFNLALEENAGGSCRVSAVRAQITETLKQFPTINKVVISINGKTEEILQP